MGLTGGGSLVPVFLLLAAVFIVLALGSAWFMQNPPGQETVVGPAVSASSAIFSGRFILMWVVFFCNITAGISIISFQSPLLQSLLNRSDPTLSMATLAASGATLIAVSSLFNGAVLTAWSAGGIVGPQIVAVLKDKVPDQASTLSFIVSGAFIFVGFI